MPDEFEDFVEEIIKTLNLGATNRFPGEKISEDDQGELKSALKIYKDKIVLIFGKKISWVSMTPSQARDFATGLIVMADKIDKKIN